MLANGDNKIELKRRGVVLTPDYNQRREAGGVLNPAAASYNGKDYLLYRAVDSVPHNYSRILVAELRPDGPEGQLLAHRLDVCALEPEESYEKWSDGKGGGVEDPRITRLEDGSFIMAYVGYGDGPGGDATPRIALARSQDLLHWERLGLVSYSPLELRGKQNSYTLDMQTVSNKDAAIFPKKIGGRYVLMHRPTLPEEIAEDTGISPSIWFSYSDDLLHWTDHRLIMSREYSWENMKVGGGTPPVLTRYGWLMVYHGVQGENDADPARTYRAGIVILDPHDPHRILYRSAEPVLGPDTDLEKTGVVNNVVFPTGVIVAEDGRLQVFYGMADAAIGVAETVEPVM
jgi:predicted GH43/DUF377 family glycosyl hydrolase